MPLGTQHCHILLAGCALHAALQQWQTAVQEWQEASGSQHASVLASACAQGSQRVRQVRAGQVHVSWCRTGSKAEIDAVRMT